MESVDPCTLLTKDDLSELGVDGQGADHNTAKSRGCQWSSGGGSLVLAVRPHQGLDKFGLSVDHPIKDIRIAGRAAKQQKGFVGGCVAGVAVTDSSSFDVTVSLSQGDLDKQCSVARRVAKMVVPHLPGS